MTDSEILDEITKALRYHDSRVMVGDNPSPEKDAPIDRFFVRKCRSLVGQREKDLH